MKRLLLAAVLLGGCASSVEEEAPVAIAEAILPTQRLATLYPEAVTVFVNNGDNDFCTGVIVAPRVVLTASHCVAFNPDDDGAGPHGTWTIQAPFAAGGAQTRTASSGEPYNPDFYSLLVGNYDMTDSAYHDLALIYMDTAFTGIAPPIWSTTQYPTVANQQVSAVGRSSPMASAGLVLSSPVTLSATIASDGYPNDNKTPRITTGGDSGGPLFLEGTHTFVGTETRFDPGRNLDYWARLDGPVYTFVQSAIAAHGGATNDPVVDFETQIAASLCGRAATCCKNSNASYVVSPTGCRAVYAKFGFEATARELLASNHGNITIDATKKSACLTAIGNTTVCQVTSAVVKANVANCIAAVGGKVGSGGACSQTVECANGACIGGTCVAIKTAGASCEIADKSGSVDERYDLAQDLCSKRGGNGTLFCDGYDFVGGAYKAESTWTCQGTKANGASCGTNPECSSFICAPFGQVGALTCVAQTPFVTSSVCAAFD